MDILNPCFKTWSRQGQGFVCVSEKTGVIWRDRMFKWPQDEDKVKELVNSRLSHQTNLYWAPLVFKTERRDKNQVNLSFGSTFFADLDPIDPKGLPIKPTLAWESSPGRYQALWWIKEGEVNSKELEYLNKALTHHIKADPSGWDLTQVLRIPGTYNYKYNPPEKGKVLWFDPEAVYSKKDIRKIIPETEFENKKMILDSNSATISLIELLHKYREIIPRKVSTLLQYPESRIQFGKRSDILWYVENELVKAQIPLEDIIQLVGLSAWNKYSGRNDEWKRLTTEISKIYKESTKKGLTKEDTSDQEDGEEISLPWVPFSQFMGSARSSPGYLIKNLWLKRSQGIIAGEPKTFKSTISLDIAISVASGKPLWNRFLVEDQGPVLVIQNENPDWIVRDKIEKITYSKKLVGAVTCQKRNLAIDFPPELPIHFLNNYGYTFNDSLHRDRLETMLEEVRPKLVIFDPLYLMFDGDINSAKELNPILLWLLKLKNDFNTSIMIIHHRNKSGTRSSSRGGQRMLGSTTLHGWVESALYIELPPDQEQLGKESDKELVPRIIIERELRGDGALSKLTLEMHMGGIGDPTYNPKLIVDPTSELLELLDLLSMYPNGMNISQVTQIVKKDMGMSKYRLDQLLMENPDKVKLINESGRSSLIKLS